MEITVTRKPHLDRSDKKRTPGFDGEIQAMTDRVSGKSISSITKNPRVCEFLIKQLVHKNIRYFK